MISAVTGPILNVAGRRMAQAPAEPMPGSAPTVVPIMTPMAQKSRLMGVNATASPWSINRIVSTKSPP